MTHRYGRAGSITGFGISRRVNALMQWSVPAPELMQWSAPATELACQTFGICQPRIAHGLMIMMTGDRSLAEGA